MPRLARSACSWLVTGLICVGGWQLGQGVYIPAKAWLAQTLLQYAWERTARGEPKAAPWPWADTWPVARLSTADGNIDLIVLAGGSGRTLAFGPAHLSASAMPGDAGNTIIAGHRDTHFNFLKDLRPGQTLVLETPGGSKVLYQVVSLEVVDSRRAGLLLEAPIPVLSLVTCYPFDSVETGGPLRFVVTGRALAEST